MSPLNQTLTEHTYEGCDFALLVAQNDNEKRQNYEKAPSTASKDVILRY